MGASPGQCSEDTTGMAGSSRLPEVPLQWSEFMWSLERLRNKPYDKKMRERLVVLEVYSSL